jgi:isocitrate/isopropylmalate dehydrogenase
MKTIVALGGEGIGPEVVGVTCELLVESVHGSAPDIAGQGIANPTATALSAAMMLEHMGLPDAAMRLEAAIATVYRDGAHLTRDQGGTATTREFGQAVLAALRNR